MVDLPLKVEIIAYRQFHIMTVFLLLGIRIKNKKTSHMKLRNILSIVSFLIIAIACSNENDVLNEITKGGESLAGSGDAIIEFALDESISHSKPIDGEFKDNLKNCSLILFEKANGSKIYRAYDDLSLKETGVNTGKYTITHTNGEPFYVQVKLNAPTTFHAKVIANSTQKFAECETLTDVILKTQDKTDLNNLVKMNDALVPIQVKAENIKPSLSEAKNVPAIGDIHLQQLAAQIEFAGINIKFGNTNPVNVELSELKVNNVVTKSYTKLGSDPINTSLETVTWCNYQNLKAGDNSIETNTIKTFRNPAGNLNVSFKLKYKRADGTDIYKDFDFVINRKDAEGDFSNGSGHEFIESGYIYQVQINMTLTSNSITCSPVVCVKDWVYNKLEDETIEINLQN